MDIEQSDDVGQTVSFGFTEVAEGQKASMVRGVFDAVANRYDIMNDIMSFGLHRGWKDALAARLNPQPGEKILDLAGGTGDLARRFSALAERARMRRGGPKAHIVVVDINEEMIRAGLSQRGRADLDWMVADAEALPVADASVDAYVISFGIRNVTHIDKALAEARRVLKPGGRFMCLEFSKPTTGALEKIYDVWSFEAIPRFGKMVTGDGAPYQYLVESIRRFPEQKVFADMMDKAGFKNVSYRNFSGGIVALHMGWAL